MIDVVAQSTSFGVLMMVMSVMGKLVDRLWSSVIKSERLLKECVDERALCFGCRQMVRKIKEVTTHEGLPHDIHTRRPSTQHI